MGHPALGVPNLTTWGMKMQRIQATRFLLFGLMIGSSSLQAKEKVKIEVVEASTYTYTDTTIRTIPATPEQTVTNCQGTSGIYSPNYGSTCVTTKSPATPEHPIIWPTAIGAFDAVMAILPDGEHVILMCDRDHEKHCDRFVDEKNAGIEKNCRDDSEVIVVGSMRYLCEYTMQGGRSLGMFQAEINGDKVTIWGPNGKREYDKSSTWGGQATSNEAPANNPATTQTKGGDSIALDNLGVQYDQGLGVPLDHVHAAVLYRKAAEQGDAVGQYFLGYDYFVGQGVPQDYKEAAAWYRKAAKQGNANAQYNLGTLYFAGQGVTQDYSQAVIWVRKAADQNDAVAECSLGTFYEFGTGVVQNYAEAYFWLDIGAAVVKGADHDTCQKNREILSRSYQRPSYPKRGTCNKMVL